MSTFKLIFLDSQLLKLDEFTKGEPVKIKIQITKVKKVKKDRIPFPLMFPSVSNGMDPELLKTWKERIHLIRFN